MDRRFATKTLLQAFPLCPWSIHWSPTRGMAGPRDVDKRGDLKVDLAVAGEKA